MQRTLRRSFFERLFAIALLALSACSKQNEGPAPSASQRPAEVVAPAGLVAEISVPEPRRLWPALKKLGGSRAEVLPSSWELGLFSVLDLPPRAAGYVRAETPIVGAVVAPPGASPVLVLGVRLVRGSELIDGLTRGDSPPLRAERDGSPLTLLVGSKQGPALGVVDDWLLVGGDAAALRSTGVYVARGLGARRLEGAPLTLEVNRAALAGPLATSVRARWAALRAELREDERAARAEHGRAPDFADPVAILGLADKAIDLLLSLLQSSERLVFTMHPGDDKLGLSLSVVPQAEGALARTLETLEVGALDPLLELPDGVLVAALLRSSETERNAAAEKPADMVRSVLGPRLAEKDAAPLAGALRSFHLGRGATAVCGAFADRSLFLRQDVREPKELERGLRGLLGLLRVRALADPLEPLIGKVSPRESARRVAGVEGPVHRVELVARGPRTAGVEVLVHVRGGSASVVGGASATEALVALTTERRETLGKSAALAGLARDRVPSAIALYADLALLRPAGGPAPVLAVLGKKAGKALLEVELSAAAGTLLFEHLGTP